MVKIRTGPRGGKYYVKNGKKIYMSSTTRKTKKRRKNPMKGWKKSGPRPGKARKKLLQNCGRKCFLKPESLKFPVCKACGQSFCSCRYDCRGLLAAEIRAKQWKYPLVAAKAGMLYRQHCFG